MSLPFAIYAYGYVLGTMIMILAAAASFFGLFLYIQASEPLGRQSSPFSLAKVTYPRLWVVLDLAIVLKCVGVSLSYLLIIGDLMTNFMLGCVAETADVDQSVWTDSRVWIALFMLIIVPLSFLKRMDHLRYSSFLGLASIIYLTALSVVSLIINPPETINNVVPFIPKFSSQMLASFGVFIFAFTCHQNIFPLINETKKNSVNRMSFISVISIAISFCIYLIYGLCSYVKYADHFALTSSMFSLYPKDPAFQLARMLFAFLLATSYPLQVLPFRNSFERLILLDEAMRKNHGNKIYIASTSLLLVITFGISMRNPPLGFVFGLVGSMTSSVVSYILPAVFYLKVQENEPWKATKILAAIFCAFGCLVFLICTGASIARPFL